MKETLTIFFYCLLAASSCSFISSLYHSNEEIYSLLDKLASGKCNNTLLSKSITEDGNTLKYYTLTSKASSSKKNKAVIIFGEHSRELITSELALYLIQTLCKEHQLFSSSTIDSILNRNELILVPIVNEYGRKQVEKGDYCFRRNKNDVDLNRNWGTHWEPDQLKSSEANRLYSGSKPFSEWEVRAVRSIIEAAKPEIFITTHSGIYAMFTPFAYKESFNDPQINKMISIIKRINDKYCHCSWGSIYSSLPYPVSGGSLDFAYEEMKVKYSFAFEIYGGHDSNEYFQKLYSSADPQEVFNAEKASMINLIQLTAKLRNGPIATKNKRSKPLCFVEKRRNEMKGTECFEKGNPQTQVQYDKTLINWVNIYFELFTIICNLENK